MTRLMGGFYRISEWITRLAYANLLWIAGNLLGLFLLGFFPATAALFAITRKWVMGEADIPVFRTFWKSYKEEFVKGNLMGLIVVIIGYILYIDFNFLLQLEGSPLRWLYLPLLGLTFFYVLLLFYLFPVMVHYELNKRNILKNSFLFSVTSPITSMVMLLGGLLIYFIMIRFPGLMIFFGGSSLALLLTGSAHFAFRKNQKRIESNRIT
ncbi:YesL family protein [Ammoniphilus sp. YIM 78166]|uniref:YesL family protein n=1 Tax=Ammoniphilus sp. YIM 78166 TaxID=1644106 RepID=UPI00106FE358|nr:YesL family protein [Ammoniphilus sp. YIM 78166]